MIKVFRRQSQLNPFGDAAQFLATSQSCRMIPQRDNLLAGLTVAAGLPTPHRFRDRQENALAWCGTRRQHNGAHARHPRFRRFRDGKSE